MLSDRVCFTREISSTRKIGTIQKSIYQSKENLSVAALSCSTKKVIIENELYETDSDVFQHYRNSNNRRQYLHASQILGKLKKLDEVFTVKCSKKSSCPKTQKKKISARQFHYYKDLLRSLLEYRCLLMLNEEQKSCLQQTVKSISDLKCVYNKSIQKLTTMPVMTYNRFIDCSDININSLKLLFKKIIFICDLHSSLRNSCLEVIFLNTGFDPKLYEMLKKMGNHLGIFYFQLFYWTLKVLEIFIIKLSLADPETISPELLCTVVNVCEISNSLFLHKHMKRAYLSNNSYVLFNCFIYFDFKTVLLNFIIKYLSHFEAKVAAEKIMQCLIYECRYQGYANVVNEKHDKSDKEVLPSSTSDYYSASSSVFEGDNSVHMKELVNFNNIYLSILQRNQLLVLKYLYSTTCLHTKKNRKDIFEESGNSLTGINAWNILQNEQKSKQYLLLEDKYWIVFWEKVFNFFLKLVLEVPCHQYGKSAIGIFLLWPGLHRRAMLSNLQSSRKSIDKSEDFELMKKIFCALFTNSEYESWNKRICYMLSLMKTQPCFPIPVASNKVRTRIGNALCSCLQTLNLDLPKDFICSNKTYLQRLHLFQATLDYFAFVININARASVSAFDVSSYLLLCRSDCVYASEVLGRKEASDIILKFKCQNLFSFSNMMSSIIQQLHNINGHVVEAQNVIYLVVSCVVRRNACYLTKNRHLAIMNNDRHSNQHVLFSLNDILNSFSVTLSHLLNTSGILSSIQMGVVHGLLSFLETEHIKLSIKKLKLLKSILSDFMKWLHQQNIEPSQEEIMNNSMSFKRLTFIMNMLETSARQKCCQKVSNKVVPSDLEA